MSLFDDVLPKEEQGVGGGLFDDVLKEKPKPTAGERLASTGLSIASGAMRAVKAPADLVNVVAPNDLTRGISDFFQEGIDGARDIAPDSIKRERENQILSPGVDGGIDFNMPNATQIIDVLAESAPMIPGLLLGGGALSAGAKALGAAPRVAQAIGYGGANAAFVAPAAGDESRREALAAGLSEDQARDAELTAAGLMAPISAVTGAAGLGLAAKMGAGRTALSGAARGFAADAPFEAIEEGAESAVQDIAAKREIDPLKAGSAAILGGIAGGLPGAAVGALEAKRQQDIANISTVAATDPNAGPLTKAVGLNPQATVAAGQPALPAPERKGFAAGADGVQPTYEDAPLTGEVLDRAPPARTNAALPAPVMDADFEDVTPRGPIAQPQGRQPAALPSPEREKPGAAFVQEASGTRRQTYAEAEKSAEQITEADVLSGKPVGFKAAAPAAKSKNYDLAYNLPKNTRVGTADDLSALFATASTKPSAKKESVRYGVVSGEAAKKLKAATGLDLDGYRRSVDNFAARKVFNDHGTAKTETPRGQQPVTTEDFKKIPDIVEHYDKVEPAGKDAAGNDLIRYTKRYNGHTYYVEEVRTGRNELMAKTMWKTRSRVDLDVQMPQPNQRTPAATGGNLSSANVTPGANVEQTNGEVRTPQVAPASNGRPGNQAVGGARDTQADRQPTAGRTGSDAGLPASGVQETVRVGAAESVPAAALTSPKIGEQLPELLPEFEKTSQAQGGESSEGAGSSQPTPATPNTVESEAAPVEGAATTRAGLASTMPAADAAPTTADVLRADGKPFPNKLAAGAARAKAGQKETHDIVPVEGGFALRKKAAAQPAPDTNVGSKPQAVEKVEAKASEKDPFAVKKKKNIGSSKTSSDFAESSRKALLAEIRQMGGITQSEMRDITGEGRANKEGGVVTKAGGQIRVLFTKNGVDLDRVRERMAEMGYFSGDGDVTGDLSQVRAIIRAALDGDGEATLTPSERETYDALKMDERTAADEAAAIHDLNEEEKQRLTVQDQANVLLDEDTLMALAERHQDDQTYFAALQEAINAKRKQDESDGSGQDDEEARGSQAGETQGRAETARADEQEVTPPLELQQQTEQQLRDQEERISAIEREQAQLRKAAKDRAAADKDRDNFSLTGSDRPADVAMAGGQASMFGASGQPAVATGPRKGEVGGMMEAGEVVLTATGRKTTPFPKINFGTNRKAALDSKNVGAWLMKNALLEAEARGENSYIKQFRKNLEDPSLAEKLSAEWYLFEDGSMEVMTSSGSGQPTKPAATAEPAAATAMTNPTVKESLTVEPQKQPDVRALGRAAQGVLDAATTPDPDTRVESITEADRVLQPADLLQRIDDTFESLQEGTATVEQYQDSFRLATERAEAVKEALNAKTKDELVEMAGGHNYFNRLNSKKKGEIVEDVYESLVRRFALGKEYGPTSYMMGQRADYEAKKAAALKALVAGQTADSLAEYAAEVKRRREEIATGRAARLESLKNPKSVEEFNTVMRIAMDEGKTLREARMTLTTEQRAEYDRLSAEASREKRKGQKEARREVTAAGQKVDGQIIETKHTQKGYDLFVVQLSERVSREDYDTLNAGAKRMGGYYSSFRGRGAVPGFQFKDRATAEAFVKLANGDASEANEAAKIRRDVYEDDRSQTASERLTEMADRLDAEATEWLTADRKVNTARRARQADAIEKSGRIQQAMARTMRNIANGITSGEAKFLDRVRQKVQVELLENAIRTAKSNELREKYPDSYSEQEKRRGEPATSDTVEFADFPSFTAFRSDLAALARQMEANESTVIGRQLMKVADDVTDEYAKFVKENFTKVTPYAFKNGELAQFARREDAEGAIKRGNLKGKAIVMPLGRGKNAIVMSPSEAMARGIWQGDGDKRITLKRDFGEDLVQRLGRMNRRAGADVRIPWQFETASARLKALARMGIETPAEYRSALREFIGLRERAVEADRVKQMERAMIGRKNDGLDFFPTPATVADEMIEAAGIEPDMAVLEPSAGMGHIADRIRAAGAEPDVIEMSGDRRELLEAKGFNVIASDFMEIQPREFFTYGDTFRAPDGTEGVMRGKGGMGSNRVRLEGENGTGGYYDRDELTPVRKNGYKSGYDRIVMNPPFSDGRDMIHVRHAYDLLKPGGRLVAIMGEGAFFRDNKQAREFREWLESVEGTDEKLAEGSFLDPTLPVNTGVNARMVVIEKPAGNEAEKDPVDFRLTGTTEGAMSFDQVELTVKNLLSKWDNAPPVVVLRSMMDPKAPQIARDTYAAQQRGGAKGAPRGFIYKGVVYVVADTQQSPKRVVETVFHEALGHYGLRGVFGADLVTVLRQVANMRKAEVDAKMKQYGFQDTESERLRAAEEVLAEMAESRPELGFVQRAIAVIRDFLRKLGVNLMLSDNDIIANFLIPARRFVESGTSQSLGGQGTSPAFAISAASAFSNSGNRPNDYVLRNGSRDLAMIPQDAEMKTRGEVQALPVRLHVGRHFGKNRGFGLAHIDAEHGNQIREKGLTVEQFVAGVLDGAAKIYAGDGTRLTIHNERSPYGNAYVELRNDGGYYSVVTAFSEQRPKGKLVWSGRNGILSTQGSEPSASKGASATTGQSVSPSAQNVGGGAKPNPTTEALAGQTSSVSVPQKPTISNAEQDDTLDFKLGDAAPAIRQRVGEFLDTKRTFNDWWHKTVGTQYHKAQVDKDYGRVFNRGQEYLTDVSRLALGAADAAPDILPRFESLKDLAKSGASPRELKPVADAIFRGTLEDEKVYSDNELRTRYQLNPKQIRLYRQARAAIDRSLEDTAITEMVQLVRKDVSEATVRAASAAGTMRAARDILADALEGNEALIAQLDSRVGRVEQLKDKGYAPLMRFGRYSVYVTGEQGEQLYYGMFEDEADAKRTEREMREQYPKANIQRGVVSEESYKMFRGITPDTAELFADVAGFSENEAVQQYLKIAVNNRSALKRLIQRKGIEGYNPDLKRVLAQFITSNARVGSGNLHQGEMLKAWEAIPKEKGDVKDEAARLIGYVREPQEEAQRLRSFLFFNFLGGSVASAAVNMTQPVMMSFPYLSQWGAARAAAELGKAVKAVNLSSITDPALRAAMDRAIKSGVVEPHQIFELQGAAMKAGTDWGKADKAREAWQKFSFVWGRMFSWAEQFNRRLTFAAAFQIGRGLDSAALAQAGVKDAYEFAIKAINETQGVYNRGNRPDWARGAVGATLFTFKQFSISYLEFLKRLPRKQQMLSIGVMVMAAGMNGLPGIDDLDDLIDTLMQALGYSWNSKEERQRLISGAVAPILGEGAVEFVQNGVSAFLPIDIQGRLGMGNLLPGTGIGLRSQENKGREIVEAIGPAGALVEDIGTAIGYGTQAARAVAGGDLASVGSAGWSALKEAGPVAIQNAAKAIEMAQFGFYRDTNGRRVLDTDAADAAFKAIGFQPAAVARESREVQIQNQNIQLGKTVEADIADLWAQGIFEKNPDKVERARNQLMDWNSKNSDRKIRIVPNQIQRRVKEMQMTRAQRFIKRAPTELRAETAEALR